MTSKEQGERIPFGRPLIGDSERAAVQSVLDSPQLVHGPVSAAFEREFAEFLGPNAHATSVSSCTAGLHLLHLVQGIGPDDEVIVPALTHVATAHSVTVTGARPVFVDCDDTGNMDPERVRAALTPRTRAVVAVHFPGLPVIMDSLLPVSERGVRVIEDCALALGARLDGVAAGLLGHAGVFSFYPAKHLTTGEGGMVVSHDPDLIDRVRRTKAFGYDRNLGERRVPGVYDIAGLGLNYRMGELAAAIGRAQLVRLPDFLAQRHDNASRLRALLSDVAGLRVLPGGDERRTHADYCLVVVLEGATAPHRDEVLLRLKAEGIGASVYYPVALPMSRYYQSRWPCDEQSYPKATALSRHSLALPVGPHLDEDDMATIAAALTRALFEIQAE